MNQKWKDGAIDGFEKMITAQTAKTLSEKMGFFYLRHVRLVVRTIDFQSMNRVSITLHATRYLSVAERQGTSFGN